MRSPYVRAEETARLLLDSAGITGSAKLRMDK